MRLLQHNRYQVLEGERMLKKIKKYKKKQSVFRALEEDGRGYGLKSNTAGWEKEMRACVTGWTKEREMALS